MCSVDGSLRQLFIRDMLAGCMASLVCMHIVFGAAVRASRLDCPFSGGASRYCHRFRIRVFGP
eukprot:scaffold300715_cov17-Prasinocladus_malaysianus.AAC.2